MNKNKQKSKLTKGDKAMLSIARMQILLEKSTSSFTDGFGVLSECLDIIKKTKIPKKYLIAESLDESTNKI